MAPVLQDTTRVRERPRRRFEEEERPDSVAARPDSLAADSLAAQADPFPAPDSIMQLLMERPGYRPVVYRGDTLQFSTSDRAIHIRQRANIERAGEKLSADSVVYEGQSRFVTAYGKSKLVNAKGEEVDSDVGPLFYHTDRRIGTVMGGKTTWEIWNVEGNFTLEGTDTLWVRSGHFTSCELPEPHYRFESDRIKLVLGHIVVAWPVRLYFGDVPVFWFPFMAQDIRRGRHSGILTLRFGFNDIIRNSSTYSRHISNVGYYWAISDYTDAQFSMDWWSDTWTRFDTFFRYRWRQKFLDGRIGLSQFFRPDGREISGSWNHSQKFGERSDLRASVQFVSSQQFNRENEYNPERLTQNIRSNIGYSRRFDWGSLNLSAQRVQPLSDSATTTMTLPQLSLTLTPVVLTPARSPLEARWYSDLTWTGSTSFSRTSSQATGQPDQATTNGSVTSNLTLGNLRWNSSGNLRDQTTEFTRNVVIAPDTGQALDTIVVLGPSVTQGEVSWRSSLGYQQRLIGSSTITPALNLDGRLFRSNASNLNYVSAPTRISVSASLNSDVYGFFPGFGPWERIRHKFSPVFSWSYSPEVQPSDRLRELGFPTDSAAARHQITMTLSQTFEAKLKPRSPEEDSQEEEQASDRPVGEQAEGGAPPDSTPTQQPPESRKITVMAIRTSALAYDFVTGKLITGQVSNSLTSDLLRGLTVRFDHDLFDESAGRRFAPFLTQLNLGFSLGERTVAGLFGEPSGGLSRGGIVPEPRGFDEDQFGMFPEDERSMEPDPSRREDDRGARRPWSVSVDYSLVRQRPNPDRAPVPDRQSIRANLGFSPTQNWSLNWRTTFDVERSDFVDHTISLRRDLHRWSATFEFWQSANGNFVFNFRVNLNDLRDVKFDYRQETRG